MATDEGDPLVRAAAMSAFALKLPPFWPKDPDTWFAQVEAQFATRGISAEKTRFDYLVASLAPDTATEVRDLILAPPADTPYTQLKSTLIKRFAGSNQQKLQRLLNEVELGDSKPHNSFVVCACCGVVETPTTSSYENCSCSDFLVMSEWF